MKENGFTLIELLAVIVILSIIALIATPIVINVIENSKMSAINISVQNYLKAVEISLEKNVLTNLNNKISNGVYRINKEGNICIGTFIDDSCNGKILEINISGELPTGGVIEIKDSKVGYYELDISEKTLYKINPTKEDCFETKENDDGTLTISRFVCAPKIRDFNQNKTIQNSNKTNNIRDVIIPVRINDKLITSIGDYSFYGNGITSVVIPSSIQIIGVESFKFNNLSSIQIPFSVTTIKATAFYLNSLKSVIISDGVKTIEGTAFRNNLITSLRLPSTLTSISYNSFMNNKLPQESAYIYKRNNDGSIDYTTIIGYGGESKEIEIPEEKNGIKLTTIADSAFRFSGITSVVIPKSVVNIGMYAFYGNTFTSVIIKNLEENVTIDSQAFGSFDVNNIVWNS